MVVCREIELNFDPPYMQIQRGMHASLTKPPASVCTCIFRKQLLTLAAFANGSNATAKPGAARLALRRLALAAADVAAASAPT
jgi:hypothetical protein